MPGELRLLPLRSGRGEEQWAGTAAHTFSVIQFLRTTVYITLEKVKEKKNSKLYLQLVQICWLHA